MAIDVPQDQLTFDVGGEKPTVSLAGFSGRLFTHRQLSKGEELHLQVVDADGQTVADGYGRVVGVAFKDKLGKEGELVETERFHSVKVS